ncbi:MAG: beta strand repeat-containing protein, partial [Isosphaeraceae bacterium]
MNGLSRRVWRVGRDGLLGREAGSAPRASRRLRSARVRFEPLEERCLLAVLDIAAAGGSLIYTANSGSTSALTIKLDPSNSANVIFTDSGQTISLSGSGTTSWTGGTTNTVEGPLSSFSSVAVNGIGATLDQSLTIDYSNGDPLPSSGLAFNPQNPSGASNALTLTSGASGVAFLSEAYAASGPGAGTITYSDGANSNVPITFTGLSPVTDTVPSPTYIFTAPPAATTVNVVDAATPGQTEINAGATGAFEKVDFAGKTAVTVNANNPGATTTVDVTSPSAALAQLLVNSGAGNDAINVQGTPAGVTTTTDTGSPSGSTTNIGLAGKLSSILGPLVVQSTGATTSVLSVDDSAQTVPTSYTISNSTLTATSFPTTISIGSGFGPFNLKSSGGSTVNLDQLSQSGIATFNFTGGAPLGDNTLNVTSNVATLNYGTAGTLTFGAGEPTINYSMFPTVNVTKLATAPAGTGVTINARAGQPLNNVVVANFTESDLTNRSANFVASINWGDGTTTGGTITPVGTTGFQVEGSHTYAASGPYTVNVTLTDQSTSGTTTVPTTPVSTTLNVTSSGPVNSTPSPIVSTANVSPGGAALLPNSVYNFNGVALKGVVQDVETTQDVATFQSNDTTATPSDFTASINWGDGTTTAGLIAQDASGLFHVSGTHLYTSAGAFTPTVTIRDVNGQSYATGSFYQTNWVSSILANAPQVDSNLINPWGLSSSSTGPIWVSDQGKGVSTLYNPNANPIKLGLTVTVPPSGTPSGPTGQLFNNDP